MAKKALLMILDGWGIGKHGKGDVIYNTPTPYLDYLTAVSAHSQLLACGEDVGLPEGQMVREAAKLIQGGGGGQPHFAQAGGKNVDGLSAAVDKVVELAQL